MSLTAGLSLALSSAAQTAGGEAGRTIRLFLTSGAMLDFRVSDIDSIAVRAGEQRIYLADTCRSIPVEDIDSVWYMSPVLRLTTSGLDFGKVAVGNTKTLGVTLTNTGDQVERYTLLTGGAFGVQASGMGLAVKPGESADVELTFAPTDSIAYSSKLFLTSASTAGGLMSIPLAGEGISDEMA